MIPTSGPLLFSCLQIEYFVHHVQCIGIAVDFALDMQLCGILPKALVAVVKYGCINTK